MISTVFGADEFIKDWVAKRLNIEGFGPSVAIGIQRDSQLIGGVVYHDWRDGQIEASIATSSPGWATRSVLHTIFAFPFSQVGVNRILVTCDASNKKAMKMNHQLGFTQEGVLRQLYPPHDGIVWGMLQNECKWLRSNSYGQKQANTAANT